MTSNKPKNTGHLRDITGHNKIQDKCDSQIVEHVEQYYPETMKLMNKHGLGLDAERLMMKALEFERAKVQRMIDEKILIIKKGCKVFWTDEEKVDLFCGQDYGKLYLCEDCQIKLKEFEELKEELGK